MVVEKNMQFKMLENGIKVPTREAASEYIRKFMVSEEKIQKIGNYIPVDNEVKYLKAALTIPGKPIALAGPPGVGKTTLVYNIAYEMKVPLVRYSPGAQPYQIVGMPPDVETREFSDSPLTALVRSGEKGLVLFDDAIKLDPRVFSLIANMMDRIQEIQARSNELLTTDKINIIFTYNCPTELDVGNPSKDFPEFIRNRLSVIRFKMPDGETVIDILKKKYNSMKSKMANRISEIIKKYEKALADLYNELNSSNFLNQYEGIITVRCTTRMVERVVEIIAAGLEPLEAVRNEIANSMFDVDSPSAQDAIEGVINNAKNKGIK